MYVCDKYTKSMLGMHFPVTESDGLTPLIPRPTLDTLLS
jgi:hypothetical protein